MRYRVSGVEVTTIINMAVHSYAMNRKRSTIPQTKFRLVVHSEARTRFDDVTK